MTQSRTHSQGRARRTFPGVAVVTLWSAFTCALLVAVSICVAAEPLHSARAKTRPKICLALSGGGARGAAHIGVLKVLEELRIPVDCIAATSMGSLVGAAYATGTTIAEMEEIAGEISVELLYKEKPPRKELSMRQKEDDYSILFGPEFGIHEGKLALPKGVVSGVQLETVLRHLSKAKGFRNFDDLPIPFRAVATDLLTGKAVVFREGELANVMRASMSVPGAVAPAEFEGMMLVDGMLTNNLPVEVARDMGADVVIAVNVGTPLLKREQLNGFSGVTAQMLSILTEQNVRASLASLKSTDILISPELESYSTADFDDLQKIAPLGEVAARNMRDRLTALSIPPAEYADLRQRQLVATEPDLRPIAEIRFETLRRVNPSRARAVMETRTAQPIDQAVLDSDMRRLYGTGDFERVNYRFLEEPGKRVLAVDAVEKTWGPDYLRFGLGLSSDFKGDAYFDLLASYRKTWLNTLGGEWRTDVQVGRISRLNSEFYQPLDTEQTFFVAPRINLERRPVNIYQGSNRIASYDLNSQFVGVDMGTRISRYGELRLGVVRGVMEPRLDTGPQSVSPGEPTVGQGAIRARLVLDQADSTYFPRYGWRGSANVFKADERLAADNEYTKWDADGTVAYSLGEHTLNLSVKAGDRIGSRALPRYDLFQWGGFLRQSGYATGQLIGENLRYGRMMYYRRILRGGVFEGAYGGVTLEASKVGNPLVPGNGEGLLKSASVFVASDTAIGPVYLGYGRTRDGISSFYFYLGRAF